MMTAADGAQRRCMVAASQSDAFRLAEKCNHVGDLIFARVTKPRSPGFHRLAHRIGMLVVENVPTFSHHTPHTALKRLQVESQQGCEMMSVQMSGIWSQVLAFVTESIGAPFASVLTQALAVIGMKGRMVTVAVPLSLSYDTMDETEFRGVVKGLCRYISQEYWPSMSPEDIEAMAETTGDLTE